MNLCYAIVECSQGLILLPVENDLSGVASVVAPFFNMIFTMAMTIVIKSLPSVEWALTIDNTPSKWSVIHTSTKWVHYRKKTIFFNLFMTLTLLMVFKTFWGFVLWFKSFHDVCGFFISFSCQSHFLFLCRKLKQDTVSVLRLIVRRGQIMNFKVRT